MAHLLYPRTAALRVTNVTSTTRCPQAGGSAGRGIPPSHGLKPSGVLQDRARRAQHGPHRNCGRRSSLRLRVQAAAIKRPGVADDSAIDYSGAKATLNQETVWRLQLGLQEGAPPVVLKVIFDRDEGYEPPQGVIRIVEDEMQVADTDAVNRWELGEDPDAKSSNPMDGGGLWIWAFFSETPFPFMLFSLQLTKFGTVYAKVPHAMGPKRGTVLSEGTITTRTMVDVAADVIGLSRAQIAEQQPAGTIRLGPMDRY